MKRLLVGMVATACVCIASAAPNFIGSGQRFHDSTAGEFTEPFSDEQERESGQINGLKYQIYYRDGSAAFSGAETTPGELNTYLGDWSVRCEADPIHDLRNCFASRGDFHVFYTKKFGVNVSVGSSNFPRSLIWVRVDGGKAVSASEADGFGRKASELILNQIKNGSTVVHRYKEWPYDVYKDSVSKFYGTQEVVAYMKWAVGRK